MGTWKAPSTDAVEPGRRNKFAGEIEQMRRYPGRYMYLQDCESEVKARNLAGALMRGKRAGFEPNEFTAVADKLSVFACYGDADPDQDQDWETRYAEADENGVGIDSEATD